MKQPFSQIKTFRATLSAHARHFWSQNSGAVTVDWVVLTATVVAMVTAFMAGFTTDVNEFLIVLMAGL